LEGLIMGFVLSDRVRDTTSTTGTGTITVSGTPPSTYNTFSAICDVGDVIPYFIQNRTANEWEVGIGTYSAANQISRDTILASSSFGSPDVAPAAVNFSGGVKDVVLDVDAMMLKIMFTGMPAWSALGGF
jgi:hypothetical protein